MGTNSLETLVLVEIRDIRNLKHRVERLVRIIRDMRIALERTAPGTSGALPTTYYRLTSREAEVLPLIAEGYANKQIAAELAISVKTVEKHRQRMMAKLDLHDTAGVTRYAMSAGLVEAGI